MTKHSSVALLACKAVVTCGVARPCCSCEQVGARPELRVAGKGFAPHPRCVGRACASPAGKGEILHLVRFAHFFPRQAKKPRGLLLRMRGVPQVPSPWALQCRP